MLTTDVKIWLAAAAAVAAVVLLVADNTVTQGTAIVVAALFAGCGWLIRDTHEEARRLKSICQAYAAVIEAQFEEINATLSDEELNKFLQLAQSIADGSVPESIGFRAPDPFAALPDIRDHMHLLRPETARLLWKWRVRGLDLFLFYDELGTEKMCSLGHDRMSKHFEWVKRYRDEYRDIGYSALKLLDTEVSGLTLHLATHEKAGARDNADANLL